MRKLLLLFAFAGCCFGQAEFTLFKATALSGAAETITVQQPAASSKQVKFRSAYGYCSVACTITIERNGTAATSTAQTPTKINPTTTTVATATGWNTSNVGVGTVIAGPFTLAAGQGLVWDLTNVNMIGTGTAKNISLRTSSITGTVNLLIQWGEYIQ